ncbi:MULTISPECIES: hypothetical protein [unclassified Pantoea]|nr:MULTISPECIES: hypothetical protein [unclassified Pantoea]
MRTLVVLALLSLLAGCKYFSYQESCTDNPTRADCDGSHQVERRK